METNQKTKNIHRFPGHMKKASNEIKEKLKLVDFVIILLDSRAPKSSINPYLMEIVKDKKKLFLLTKSDLSDEKESKLWQKKLKENSEDECVLVDLTNNKVINEILKYIDKFIDLKKEKYLKKGIKNVSIRAMVIGIPNVGKSTLINLLSKKSIAITGNKPGVTKSNRWIKVNKNFELMDTPGILLPKFEDKKVALNLSIIGTIKEDILPLEEVFDYLIKVIYKYYLKEFNARYELSLSNDKDINTVEIIESIGRKRGLYKKNNEVDSEKVIKVILNEFRNGKIVKATIERVND